MEIAVRRMIERQAEGVAVMTFGVEDFPLRELAARRVPTVFVDGNSDRHAVSNICVDYLHGIRQAIQHLVALRHKKIAFITGPLHSKPALARKEAFVRALGEVGCRADRRLIVESGDTMESGIRAFGELLAIRAKPTALICSSDMTAIGVMQGSSRRGISVPGDISVVGFDDIRLAQLVMPPLTTVQVSQEELARLAFYALLRDVERGAAPNGSEYLLKTNLVLRASTSLLGAQESEQ